MSQVLYCGVCTMPPEYCRYHSKYAKCLEWMKQKQPDLFAEEIKDIQERDPKTAKKAQYLWDVNAPQPSQDNEEKKQSKQSKKSKKQSTSKAMELEKKVNFQQQSANDQLADIQSKLNQLSTSKTSPNKPILKNKTNPNYKQEQQNLNDSMNNSDVDEPEEIDQGYLGRGGNMNRRGGPPPRKDTKKRKRKKHEKRRGGRKGRGRQDEDEEDEDGENKEEMNEQQAEEDRKKMVRFMEQNKNRKIPKNIVEVSLENRKGNKRVTVVRGFIEKSKDKEQRIKSEFMKKFATSVNITFQNQGSDKGPKQVVLMGDKRYDFMKYLKDKFPKAGKLLYYKTKRFGLTPAVDPDHGFVMPPP